MSTSPRLRPSPSPQPTLRNVVDLTIYSPQLERDVGVQVYTPFGDYRSGDRYPVIYAQDGQHLFAEWIPGRTWGAGEVVDAWGHAGGGGLLVAIENGGARRASEYSPFTDERFGGGEGEAYVSFLVDTLKPEIDAAFHTETAPSRTAIVGSSLGGHLALYAHFRNPEVFGLAGALSPAVSFADFALREFVADQEVTPGRIHLDAGTHEYGATVTGVPSPDSIEYLRRVRRLRDELVTLGYVEGANLVYHEFVAGRHTERSWGARLPSLIKTLFPLGPPTPAEV